MQSAPYLRGEGQATLGEGIHSTKAKNPSTSEAGPPPFDKGGFTHINPKFTVQTNIKRRYFDERRATEKR